MEPLLPDVPAAVEVSMRMGNGGKLLVFLNARNERAAVRRIPEGAAIICDGVIAEGLLTVPADGCVIVKLRPDGGHRAWVRYYLRTSLVRRMALPPVSPSPAETFSQWP